ncbi:MAG: FAD-dependent oxidoreductase [Candidatus Eremiobacteraeota bacterium]|nr:FAD-dependent oxidoreductase [Candidatus Eremiobacteraeota bacterium]
MERYDTIVVGGGNAGCAAAIASARHGARTLLIERYGFLGGTATAAMVGPWMTFHSGETRIVGGIAQEIVERLRAMGGSPGHLHDSSDYVATITPFDPELHKVLLFEMMAEAGVTLLLHAWFLAAICEGSRVIGVRVATIGGELEFFGTTTIDATADALVAHSAGAATERGDARGRVQPASLMLRIGPVDGEALAAYLRAHPDQVRSSLPVEELRPENLSAVAGLWDLWNLARERGDVTIPRDIVSLFASPYPDEMTVNMSRVLDVDPLDAFDLTRAEIEARRQALELIRFFKMYVPGFARARILASGAQVGIRESRRIVGRYTLTREDVVSAKHFSDAVARSAYPIDIHDPSGAGTITHRVAEGRAYEIPFRCLIPERVEALLVAGRCISTTHESLASARLTPTVMSLGQAAGTAAALAKKSARPVGDIDISVLRAALQTDGVDLGDRKE